MYFYAVTGREAYDDEDTILFFEDENRLGSDQLSKMYINEMSAESDEEFPEIFVNSILVSRSPIGYVD